MCGLKMVRWYGIIFDCKDLEKKINRKYILLVIEQTVNECDS